MRLLTVWHTHTHIRILCTHNDHTHRHRPVCVNEHVQIETFAVVYILRPFIWRRLYACVSSVLVCACACSMCESIHASGLCVCVSIYSVHTVHCEFDELRKRKWKYEKKGYIILFDRPEESIVLCIRVGIRRIIIIIVYGMASGRNDDNGPILI